MIAITMRAAKRGQVCPDEYGDVLINLAKDGRYGMDTPVPVARLLDVLEPHEAVSWLNYAQPRLASFRAAMDFANTCGHAVLPLFEMYCGSALPRQLLLRSEEWVKQKFRAVGDEERFADLYSSWIPLGIACDVKALAAGRTIYYAAKTVADQNEACYVASAAVFNAMLAMKKAGVEYDFKGTFRQILHKYE